MDGIMNIVGNRLLIRVCQLVMGVIMLVAGLAKLGDLQAFATSIHNFRMIPVPTENLLAMTLPWIEVVIGVALVVGLERRAAAQINAALMLIFTVAVGQALIRNLDIECGCFGTADASSVGLKKLLENLAMLVVSFVAAVRPR